MEVEKKPKKTGPDFSEEQKLWQQGYDFVAGLDEVGRGPLAGPVVAGAVCFRKKPDVSDKFEGLGSIRDSKKFSPAQRARWYDFLIAYPGISWGIGLVTPDVIDRINILEATKLAMKRALAELGKKGVAADYLLLDGNFLLEDLPLSQKAVTRGDEKIWSCAAASIIAKVTRDRLMIEYHKEYPLYGFDKHKGYGTKAHTSALKIHGLSAIHRRSFAPCGSLGKHFS